MEEKLKRENSGILNWVIEGAMNYSQYGLSTPKKVIEANSLYKKENDGIEHFLNEKCSIGDGKIPCCLMQKEIKKFCKDEGLNIPTSREISNNLGLKFQKKSTNRGNHWVGIKIVE